MSASHLSLHRLQAGANSLPAISANQFSILTDQPVKADTETVRPDTRYYIRTADSVTDKAKALHHQPFKLKKT
jgi:hypothetical protein